MDSTYMMNPKLRRRQSCSGCLRYVMIILNLLLILLGLAVVGVFVYIALTQVWFVKGTLGTDLAIAACGLLIAGGALLVLSALVGLVGACVERTGVVVTYLVLVGIVVLTLLACIICTLVFRTWLTVQVRDDMVVTLTTYYGVDLEHDYNRQVTASWDAAQSSWQCCSVRDYSWAIYRESAWYREQPGTPDNGKTFVPASCCVTEPDGQYKDLKRCQTYTNGPPFIPEVPQYAGNPNNALYYRGCYETAKDHLLNETTWYIIGVAVGVEVFVLLGLVLGLCWVVTLKGEIRNEEKMFSDLSQPMQTVSRSQIIYGNDKAVYGGGGYSSYS